MANEKLENEELEEEASGCTHDCSTCSAKCGSKEPESLLAPQNKASDVKHVIGVVSGKGGVGKSSVTSLLAVLTRRLGFNTAILDADITGPSIPKMFGLKGDLTGCELVCVLVGERPGLVTDKSMSAYITYKPHTGVSESSRTVVSNIHAQGTPAVEAGAYVAELIEKILQKKVSGVGLHTEEKV